MKKMLWLLLTTLLCIPAAAFAGVERGFAVPTLGEIGLVMLGIGLLGGGAFTLRRRKR
ncbi:MAG: IPTL-CTERM sorting domain-containing protein [Thermoanaerobaculales bacterium]